MLFVLKYSTLNKQYSKVKLKNSNLFFKRATKKLKLGLFNLTGHNNLGRISVFTKSKRYLKCFRNLDQYRVICDEGYVVSLEHDYLRTGIVGTVCFFSGIVVKFVVPVGFEIGKKWFGFGSTFLFPVKFLLNFKIGSRINHIELYPGSGAVIARSAGTFSVISSNSGSNYRLIKLMSGKIILLSKFCVSTEGRVSNVFFKFMRVRNAGANRVLGKKPCVRGVAMNPVDHPHGGGNGHKATPVLPLTPWGKPTKWKRTLNVRV